MFTGLVEAVGEITEVKPAPGGLRLRLSTSLAPELANGDSLAVNGVCLTVAARDADGVHLDVSPETVRVTTLATAGRGSIVNLERPLRADARLGGHFVQGHVDATGTVKAVRADGDAHWLTVLFGEALSAYVIPKGSIAIDGISLTIASLRAGEFDVMVIPFTWEHTNLHTLAARDRVNLECDMVGKYVARAAQIALAPR